MPELTTIKELVSIKSYQRTLSLVRDFLSRVAVTQAGVRVTDSGVSIGLGTPESPHIEAPLEIPLRHVEEVLMRTARLADEIQSACKETMALTRELIDEWWTHVPESSREATKKQVEDRTSGLEALVTALEAASRRHGHPYHPARMADCLHVLDSYLGHGDPAIRIQVVTTVVL